MFHFFTFSLHTDDACELKIGDTLKTLAINESWININEPCEVYKCIGSIGDTKIEKRNKICNKNCNSTEEVYRSVPGECCGKCMSAFCIDEHHQKHDDGEVWKSYDNCTINECINDGLEFVISSYKKHCPKLRNCPRENIEMRDCCPYCNYREDRKLKLNFLNISLICNVFFCRTK